MSEFLYYFGEQRHALDKAAWKALCAEHGLAHLARTVPTVRGCRGPDGGDGIVVAARLDGGGSAPGYYPDGQDWYQCGTCWIGVTRDTLPGPDDLQQREILPGHNVELADEREWLMPYAIVSPGKLALPSQFVKDKEIGNARKLKERYRDFGERAFAFWGRVGDATEGRIEATHEELIALATAGLSLNYRVGEHEVHMLGVLDTENIWELCFAAIDWPGYERMFSDAVEAQKKTDSPTVPGG